MKINIYHNNNLIGIIYYKNNKILGQGNLSVLRAVLRLRRRFEVNTEEFLKNLPERLKNTALRAELPRLIQEAELSPNASRSRGLQKGNAPEDTISNIGLPKNRSFQ